MPCLTEDGSIRLPSSVFRPPSADRFYETRKCMSDHPFRFGIVAAQARSGDDWMAKARRAEALGYATMLMPDTLGATLSPLPALAVAAAATQSLRVGTYVLANDFRNPLL